MSSAGRDNVSEIIAKPPVIYVPEPRYVSRYYEEVKDAAKRGKSAHKTLGVPSVSLNRPTDFLRKQCGFAPKRPEVHHQHYRPPDYQRKLPAWEPVKAGQKNSKDSENPIDFTKRNINIVKNLQPLKARKYFVDDRHGSVHPLKPSGLFPVYRSRKNYGQLPGDRSKCTRRQEATARKEDKTDEIDDASIERKSLKSGEKDGSEKEKEKEDKTSAKSRHEPRPRYRCVTEEERAELLYGMKKKWEEMMKKFQCLPFLADTPPKAKRKTQMEKDLKQLENDIEIIDRHPYIYVYNDSEDD